MQAADGFRSGEIIPVAHAERLLLWVSSSKTFGVQVDGFTMLAIQYLGQAEGPLLAMEAVLARQRPIDEDSKLDEGMKLMECSALSQYWVFGLYEMLRTAREAKPPIFAPLKTFFQKVEVARMPLAKHEVKSASGYRNMSHYPTSLWAPETGKVGWHAFDPSQGKLIIVTRTGLANEFLALTAF